MNALYEILTGTQTTPSGAAARAEGAARLKRAIGQLPEPYRRVVELFDLEERPMDEVAAALGRSPGAGYMLRARAHRHLADLLGTASGFLGGSA